MTNITWKNGGPLFLQPSPGGGGAGQFAADQNCCCPPPPPPRCWDCPSLCSYGFELTSQDGLQVASWLEVCGSGFAPFAYSQAEYSFKHLFPPETVFSSESRSTLYIGPGYQRVAGVSHSSWGTILVDSPPAYCTRNFFPTPDSIRVPFFSGAEILFELMCAEGRSPTPYTLRVSVQASVFIGQELNSISCAPFCQGKWTWDSAGTFDLNSTCSSAPQKHCDVGYTDEFRFLDTPVEVTADKDTTTLGNYTSTFTNTCAGGDLSALALSIGESIRDELTATLNITSRESCLPPCDIACLTWCEQIGTLADPETSCPEGFSGNSGWCRRVSGVLDCEGCTSTAFPAPDGLTDYEVNCIGYCCDYDPGANVLEVCQQTPCCDCSDNCTVSAFVDDDDRNENGEGYRRIGFPAGEPVNWGGVIRNVEWARGYPDRIGSCYFWWYSLNTCTTVLSEGPPRTSGSISRERWRLYSCVDGEFVDVTDTYTTNGPFEQTNFVVNPVGAESAFGGVPCPAEPSSDFLPPTIDCNPLP